MSDRIPVLLDTDPGSDIDDVVALAYLLKQPRCELLGVTTVSGNVTQRAACVQVVCKAAGRRDVPIHCGASKVLHWGPGQPNVPHYAAIQHMPHRTDWPANTAVDFLRRTIRSRPGEITLLSVGPLTNIALLFALDPEIPSLLKSLVSMAGVFYEDKNEWNCKVDPIATAMVYAARPPSHTSFGLDVTMKCQLSTEAVREKFKTSPLDVVLRMAEVWFGHSPMITFHDPLAAAAIFKSEICTYEKGQITVEVSPDKDRGGRTPFTASDGPHRVAKTVDSAAFFEEYFSNFRA